MPVLDYRDPSTAEVRTLNMMSAISSIVRRMLPGIGGARTIPPPALVGRDSMIAIPTIYYGLNDGPSAGTVVGATLGSVAGFILLVWLIQTLSNNKRNSGVEEEVIVRHERSPRKRSRRSEMRSVSRGSRPERIVRQERIVRDTSRAPPPMPRSSFIVDERSERRVDGDDVVEVIEEQSSVGAPPRRKSRRGSSAGYRYK